MRKFLGLVFGLLLLATEVIAQNRLASSAWYPNTGLQHDVIATATVATTRDIKVQVGVVSHQVTFHVPSTMSAISVVVSGRLRSETMFTPIVSSSLLGDTMTFTGTYDAIRIEYSGITGSGQINADYWGSVGVSAGGATITGTIDVECVAGCAGGTQYTEDAAASPDPVGGVNILVRADTPGAVANTNGDNVAQRGTNFGAAFVQLLNSSGSFLDTVGGGTEYTEGGTDASITGTAFLMEGAANTLLPVQGTVADGLLVNLGTNNDVTITSGTITTVSTLTTITNAVTVTDGAGALNIICDSGCSGGSQYTEDAAAAADPVGNAVNLVRADTPGTITTTNGDNVAQRGTNYGAAYVQVVSSTGSFVDTFGGGTQYTEGDTDATITGTAMMLEGAANTLVAAPGTAADGLLVNLGANNDVTVTGTVTVTDGAGALNVIVDSGTITAVTSITSAVTVTDGAGALNVIVDSGTLTAVTSITNAVTVTDGSGALNVICDSGCAGGVQYTEADIDATITGTALLFEGAGNALVAATGTAADGLNVKVTNLVTEAADNSAFPHTSTEPPVGVGGIYLASPADHTDGDKATILTDIKGRVRTITEGNALTGAAPVSYVTTGATEDEHAVCTGPCTVYSIVAMNHTAASAFLRCENDTAANTTPGSETNAAGEPDLEIPGNTTGAGFIIPLPVGASFSTALTCWIVSGEASSDTTEVAANDVRVWYTRAQ